MWGVGCGVWGADLLFRISGFGFRISGWDILNFELRLSGLMLPFRGSGSGFRVVGVESDTSGFEFQIQGYLAHKKQPPPVGLT